MLLALGLACFAVAIWACFPTSGEGPTRAKAAGIAADTIVLCVLCGLFAGFVLLLFTSKVKL